MASVRASDMESMFGGSNLCALVNGIGDPSPELLEANPPLLLEGDVDRSTTSSTALSGTEPSRDMPGICTREEFEP